MSHWELLDELLVFGYIRTQILINYDIPIDIYKLCYKFFHLLSEILTFSDELKSKDGIQLSHDKTYAIKKSVGHKYVLTASDPVFTGIHCWRVLSLNPQRSWMMWAVSRKEVFQDYSYDFAWGISYDNQWFPWDHDLQGNGVVNNEIDLHHFHKEKCQVDILLDVDKKELKICLVGECSQDKEAKITNISYLDNTDKGFVPHLNIGSTSKDDPIKVQIAKIPIEWYGQQCDHIFTI